MANPTSKEPYVDATTIMTRYGHGKDDGSGSGHGINSYGDYFSDGRHCCYGYIGGDGYGFSYGDGKGGHYS